MTGRYNNGSRISMELEVIWSVAVDDRGGALKPCRNHIGTTSSIATMTNLQQSKALKELIKSIREQLAYLHHFAQK